LPFIINETSRWSINSIFAAVLCEQSMHFSIHIRDSVQLFLATLHITECVRELLSSPCK
jgi:hypothetical protein